MYRNAHPVTSCHTLHSTAHRGCAHSQLPRLRLGGHLLPAMGGHLHALGHMPGQEQAAVNTLHCSGMFQTTLLSCALARLSVEDHAGTEVQPLS